MNQHTLFRITALGTFAIATRSVTAQAPATVLRGDSVSVRLVDVDLRTAVQSLAMYMDKPVIVSGAVGTGRVTLETPRPIRRADIPQLLRGLAASQNAEIVLDSASGLYRLRAKEAIVAPQGAALGAPLSPSYAPRPSQAPELFVIHLRHAKANDVAAIVNALYGKASALGELGDRGQSGVLSKELSQLQVSPTAPLPQSAPGAVGHAAALSGEVTIVPDSRGNSLLVRASRSDFSLIQAAVNELDIRPLQVLIEVMIAEVRHDRSLDVGVEVTMEKAGVRGTQATVDLTTQPVDIGGTVVNVMDIGGSRIAATLRAAASRGDVDILSRPLLLAANNERAEINVGSQRPFVQVARVLPTDNTARDQVVQYKDVGTKLQITPTISADGYVMLQVSQEINAATAEQQFNAPIISTRSVETRLLVKDGQTIVLGGLVDRQKEHTQSGIPILSSIPWFGGFFGRLSRSRVETELYLFLTPRVIRTDEEVDGVTKGFEAQARKAAP